MIEVLVGMIASGKSTYAKNRANEGWLVINDDAIVRSVHAGDYLLYNPDLRPFYKSIEDHMLHSAILLGRDVVIDRGLDINDVSRRRWIAIAKAADVPIRAIVFKKCPPLIHALRRMEHDSRGHDIQYWTKVACSHDARYVRPMLSEGFSEITDIGE